MNWSNFRFIDLFAGIGGIRLGFESVGGKCVFSSEFDEVACKTYEANFGEPQDDSADREAEYIKLAQMRGYSQETSRSAFRQYLDQ